jgi:hypothetical protein
MSQPCTATDLDPDLARLVEAWPKLDEPIRLAILQLVRLKAK